MYPSIFHAFNQANEVLSNSLSLSEEFTPNSDQLGIYQTNPCNTERGKNFLFSPESKWISPQKLEGFQIRLQNGRTSKKGD